MNQIQIYESQEKRFQFKDRAIVLVQLFSKLEAKFNCNFLSHMEATGVDKKGCSR